VIKSIKPVLKIGVVLAFVVLIGMILFDTVFRREPAGNVNRGGFLGLRIGGGFERELLEFDRFDAPRQVLLGVNPQQIHRRLARLQRHAESVDQYLSVLRRHRELALLDRRYVAYYERFARAAAERFPFSSPIAAVAAEAVLLASSPDARTALATYAERLTQDHFAHLRVAMHILAGNLNDPAAALSIAGLENSLSRYDGARIGISQAAAENLLVNQFLIRAVRGDVAGASANLNTLLPQAHTGTYLAAQQRLVAAQPRIARHTRMAADFFYDHNNPREAARLFASLLNAGVGFESDAIRLADSLALAGEIQGARNVWFSLTAAPNPLGTPALGEASLIRAPHSRSRLFYNLAASSPDNHEQAMWLERLFSYRALSAQNITERTDVYSVIRFSRLFDTHRAISILEESPNTDPLLELELVRRNLANFPPTRASAEVWLLSNRHPADPYIYQWAAWYFEHRRLFAENARLIDGAIRNGITGDWIYMHQALAFMRQGEIANGERLLREAASGNQDWRVFANLGRIYESRRQFSSALAAYETAAALADDRPSAAQVQLRLSRNLEAIGHIHESRNALERALELDPENINIRRELRRFGVH